MGTVTILKGKPGGVVESIALKSKVDTGKVCVCRGFITLNSLRLVFGNVICAFVASNSSMIFDLVEPQASLSDACGPHYGHHAQKRNLVMPSETCPVYPHRW
eukprot:936489-Pelagomonas_calceolata.AAC.1